MNLTNFAIIKGNGKISNGTIKYIANIIDTKDEENNEKIRMNILDLKKYQPLLVRAEQKFSSGTLQFKLDLKSKNTGVLLILKANDGTSVLCGPTLTQHKFAIASEDQLGNWKTINISGDLANHNINETVTFKIQIEGSSVKLFVNNIILCETFISIKDSPIEFRLCSDKDFEIYDIEVDKQQPKIFVVMQFSQEYDELYADVIKEVAKEFGYECVRGDEFYSGMIIQMSFMK
jgi:hypothetical protein